MSDLISRSALLKEIEKYKFGAISNNAEREYVKTTILNFIECQPTAYSVNKVVEELEKELEKGNIAIDFGEFRLFEIVKQGCVGKDVEQMKATGIVRRFDDLGRIVIPKELRRQIFGTPEKSEGMPMEIFMDKDDIILRKYEENKADDVCEWEKGSSGYVGYPAYYSKCCTTNSKGLEMQTHIIADWKYCPYCGKKIKVVE